MYRIQKEIVGGNSTLESLKIMMVTHIISCDFDLSSMSTAAGGGKNTKEDPLNLASRSSEEVQVLYDKALDIHGQARELPTSDSLLGPSERGIPGGICKLYRESAINDMLNELVPGHNFKPCRSATPDNQAAGSFSKCVSSSSLLRGASTVEVVCGKDNNVKYDNNDNNDNDDFACNAPTRPDVPRPDGAVTNVESFGSSYNPPIPPVEFNFVECTTFFVGGKSNRKINGEVTKRNRYLYYRDECGELMNLIEDAIEKVRPRHRNRARDVTLRCGWKNYRDSTEATRTNKA